MEKKKLEEDVQGAKEIVEKQRLQVEPLKATVQQLERKVESLEASLSEAESKYSDLQKRQESNQHQPKPKTINEDETIPKVDFEVDTNSNAPIPMLFNSLQQNHEKERKKWQQERQEQSHALKQVESEKNLLFARIQQLEQELDQKKRSAERKQRLDGDGNKEEALTYLKNVVLKYVGAKDTSEKNTLLPVLGTMLQFDESEMKAAKQAVSDSAPRFGFF